MPARLSSAKAGEDLDHLLRMVYVAHLLRRWARRRRERSIAEGRICAAVVVAHVGDAVAAVLVGVARLGVHPGQPTDQRRREPARRERRRERAAPGGEALASY